MAVKSGAGLSTTAVMGSGSWFGWHRRGLAATRSFSRADGIDASPGVGQICSCVRRGGNSSPGLCRASARFDRNSVHTDLRDEPRPLVRCTCLLYTSDAADEEDSVDLGG